MKPQGKQMPKTKQHQRPNRKPQIKGSYILLKPRGTITWYSVMMQYCWRDFNIPVNYTQYRSLTISYICMAICTLLSLFSMAFLNISCIALNSFPLSVSFNPSTSKRYFCEDWSISDLMSSVFWSRVRNTVKFLCNSWGSVSIPGVGYVLLFGRESVYERDFCLLLKNWGCG